MKGVGYFGRCTQLFSHRGWFAKTVRGASESTSPLVMKAWSGMTFRLDDGVGSGAVLIVPDATHTVRRLRDCEETAFFLFVQRYKQYYNGDGTIAVMTVVLVVQ